MASPAPYNTKGSPYMLPPDPGVDARREKVANWVRHYLDILRGNTDMSSESYPPSVNFGLKGFQKLNQALTLNPALVQGIQPPDAIKSAFDWMFTPEATQAKNAREQAAAAAAAAATAPTINIDKMRQPPVASTQPIDMFEMPQPEVPTPPVIEPFRQGPAPQQSPFVQGSPPAQTPFVMEQPPGVTPYQQPTPPTPSPLPMPNDAIAPDYSEFNTWIDKSQPQPSDVDWGKQKRLEAFAGLAQGAANWRPGTGWGSLIAGGGSGIAQGVLDNRKNQLNAEDEYTKAMQDFATRRAGLALNMAGDEANRLNTNQDRKYDWEKESVGRIDKYKTDLFNIESGNVQRSTDAGNASRRESFDVRQGNEERRVNADNANTTMNYNVDTGNMQRQKEADNTNLASQYEVEQNNLRATHEANVLNGQRRYEMAVEKAKTEAPQVESITKDGAVVIVTKGGKRILQYQPFKTGQNKDLDLIATRYGKDSGVYKMAKAKDMLESGDDISLMKSMVEDSIQSGYAKGVFGQAYEDAMEEVQENMLTQPGSKEYPAEFAKMMTAALLKHMNLADPAIIQAFANNGSIEARYLLSGVENTDGNQGR